MGLTADHSTVLNDSNRLVVRLLPSDTVARVTPHDHYAGHQMSPEREVEVVAALAGTGAPVADVDPRVGARVLVEDDFHVSFWRHVEQGDTAALTPDAYADAMARLHEGLRTVEVATPHVMDRIAAVRDDVANPTMTPDLTPVDRDFLVYTLDDLRRSILDRATADQTLHGEPHPANVLIDPDGPLFSDFENTAHGPVEYDLGWVPRAVGEAFPDADPALLDDCRGLVLAMVTAYRWRVGDRHPSGRRSGIEFLRVLRRGAPWPSLDEITW